MTTTLSTKGQLIIPKEIRQKHGWSSGTRFLVRDRGDRIEIRPIRDVPETRLDDVAGSLEYDGPAKSLEEMEEGIAKGAREWRSSQ